MASECHWKALNASRGHVPMRARGQVVTRSSVAISVILVKVIFVVMKQLKQFKKSPEKNQRDPNDLQLSYEASLEACRSRASSILYPLYESEMIMIINNCNCLSYFNYFSSYES